MDDAAFNKRVAGEYASKRVAKESEVDPRQQEHIDNMEEDGFVMIIPKFRSRH